MVKIISKPKSWILIALFLGTSLFLPIFLNAAENPVPQRAEDTKPLGVGDKIPDISLKNADGLTVQLGQIIKNQPTVLLFYRGGWCVYCNRHFGQLRTVETPLQKLGYQIIAISPDKVEKLRESIKKHHIHYMLLSDSPGEAMKAFGVAFKVDDATVARYKNKYKIDLEKDSGGFEHHLLPVPTAYLIDQNGVIQFRYTNPDYKVRIDPQELYRQAQQMAEAKK